MSRRVTSTTSLFRVKKSYINYKSVAEGEEMQETDPDSRGQHSGFLHHEVVEERVEAVEGAVYSHRHLRPLHLVEYACHSCTQNATLHISKTPDTWKRCSLCFVCETVSRPASCVPCYACDVCQVLRTNFSCQFYASVPDITISHNACLQSEE